MNTTTPTPVEAMQHIYPWYLTSFDDKAIMTMSCPAELKHWREELAKHRSLNYSDGTRNITARQAHRGAFQEAFTALKNAWTNAIRGYVNK